MEMVARDAVAIETVLEHVLMQMTVYSGCMCIRQSNITKGWLASTG